jgi:hypothetical protein
VPICQCRRSDAKHLRARGHRHSGEDGRTQEVSRQRVSAKKERKISSVATLVLHDLWNGDVVKISERIATWLACISAG